MDIGIRCFVSRGRDKQNSRLSQSIERISRRLRITATAIAGIQRPNVGAFGAAGTYPKVAHLLCIAVSLERVDIRTIVGRRRNESERHQADLPVDTDYSYAVIAHGSDGAGNVGSMILSHDVPRVVTKIIAVKIAGDPWN